MLSTVKIIAVVLGVVFLSFGIFFKFLSADIIGLLLISTAILIDRNSNSHMTAANAAANLFVIFLGGLIFVIFNFIGALPNLDTTGATDPGMTATGLIIAGLIIVAGLFLVNRPKR